MFTSSARFLLTLAAVFALLVTMWVGAAKATEFETFTYIDDMGATRTLEVATGRTDLTCASRALTNGRVGERVVVCDIPAVARKVRHTPRLGTTVVIARLGRRS